MALEYITYGICLPKPPLGLALNLSVCDSSRPRLARYDIKLNHQKEPPGAAFEIAAGYGRKGAIDTCTWED